MIKFGHLTSTSFTSSSLQILAELVGVSENVSTERSKSKIFIDASVFRSVKYQLKSSEIQIKLVISN